MKIAVAQGSLTEGRELLLVNASNTNARLGSGVSSAIRQACGAGYQEHIARALEATYGGPMEQGQVLMTDAGTHPYARWVAHVAVMDYRAGFTGGSFPTLAVIESATRNLFDAIDALTEPVTVAMVALGAGTGQLGVREPTRIARDALLDYAKRRATESRILGVTFYGYTLLEYAAIADVVSRPFPEVLETVPEDARSLFLKEE